MAPGRQDDGAFSSGDEVGGVCVECAVRIAGEMEVGVDDACWGDDAGCGREGEGVGCRAEGRQGQAGDVFAPAARCHDGNSPSALTPTTRI